MTINLLGPLQADLAWCSRTFQSLTGTERLRVRELQLEYAPSKRSNYLNDMTRLDALILTDNDDSPELIALEIKLADRYASRYLNLEENPAYVHLAYRSNVWLNLPATRELNQVTRVHALAVRIAEVDGYTQGTMTPRVIVVHHDLDTQALQICEHYRQHLSCDAESCISNLKLSEFVGAMANAAVSDLQREVVDRLRTRYLALEFSQQAWDALGHN